MEDCLALHQRSANSWMSRERSGGYRGAAIDITTRRQAEEALQASERFLANIFASFHDGISVLDNDYHIVRV